MAKHWLEEKYGIIVTPGMIPKGGSDSRANAEALLDYFENNEEELREHCKTKGEYYMKAYAPNFYKTLKMKS